MIDSGMLGMKQIGSIFLFAWVALWPLSLAAVVPGSDDTRQMVKLNQVYQALDALYVDEVEMTPLVESAIRSMLAELDPHSAYIDAEEMTQVRESFDGEFSGIGIEFNLLRDTLIVVNTIAGGPAETVGLRPNDRIVEIDGHNAVGIKRIEVPKLLRGKNGTPVAVRVVRRGEKEPLAFRILRDKIPLNTIDAAYRIGDSVGYIKVNRFGRTTMEEFRNAYHRLQPVGALILDLRGNGGGLFEQAIGMAEFFPMPKNPWWCSLTMPRPPRARSWPVRSRTGTGPWWSAAPLSAKDSYSDRSHWPTARPCASPLPGTTPPRAA